MLLLNVLSITAQNTVIVLGKVVDQGTNEPIENVHIKLHQSNTLSTSSKLGNYFIKVPANKKSSLVFSHTSYETNYEPIQANKDTIVLDVKMTKKVEQLPDFELSNKPIPVFKSTKISIADYEFHEDKFLFLVYGKRLNKDSELILVDENETILGRHFVPGEPVELYSDYMGNVNLICKKSIYRVEVDGEKIAIYELPLEDFNRFVKPIVDTLEGTVLFSDFLEQFPRFKYYAYDRQDTTVKEVKEIVHTDMDWQYNFEYHFLSNADKQFAKRMAKRIPGYSKFDVAAAMTGFANSFLYEEVYAPLFVIDDTICIFDHYESKIWKIVDDTIEVDSVSISYHNPKRKSTWKRQLIMDDVTGVIYGVFNKNGYYYLKEINTTTGEIISERKLSFQYAEKVKVKDGFIYYTYKPTQSLTKKFLYREPY